ncbi:MAG: sigma-70 family RNA polymerase sigma factor, partial [Candidatus Eisenbacteria bacterium]|nr:sigma-70 family RNA polymerase sigma factor [Candidatus Eisenbacteria bacterium]
MPRTQTAAKTREIIDEPVTVMYARDKDAALRRYFPLVKYVVDKIAAGLPKSIERDDLINTAMIGLFDALEKYDESRGTKFETYAIWRIKGAVLDELRSLDWASRTTRRKARMIEQVCAKLDQKLGRAATEQEMADE